MQEILQCDKSLLYWINSHHYPALDALLYPISLVGELGIIWFAICLVMLILGRPGQRKAAVIILIAMVVVDRAIGSPLGHWFYRERPYLALEGIRQMGHEWPGSSFPSGHASNVWVATIILRNRWPKLTMPLVAFAILTCYSRPYFGMHYPLDVIIGAVLGLAAGYATLAIESYWKHKSESRQK